MRLRGPFRVTLAGLAGTIGVLVVAGICARLGIWQLDRLEERIARNEAIASRISLPDIVADTVLTDTTGLAYRVVELVGEYDAAHGIVLAGRGHQGTPGAHLLLPLRLKGGGAVLVHRGWLPAVDASTIDPAAHAEEGPVRPRGILLHYPALGRAGAARAAESGAGSGEPEGIALSDPGEFRRLWYLLNGESLRRQSPYPLAGMYLQELPDGAATGYPLALAPPELDNGPHLSYAIQWFIFGLIALVGWVVLLFRGERGAGRGAQGRGGRVAPPVHILSGAAPGAHGGEEGR
jgi:surfeit locus 1 family protein